MTAFTGWSVSRHRAVALGLLALLEAACSPKPPVWCDAPAGATTIVMVPSERVLRLRKTWEVHRGGEPGLRGPSAVAVDRASGMVAVADHVTTAIDLITSEGAPAWRWIRPGRGPGQLSSPAALDWAVDGTLAILDQDLQKIVQLDSEGHLVAESPLAPSFSGNLPDWWVFLRGSDIIGVPTPRLAGTDPRRVIDMFLLLARNHGAGIDTIITKPVRVFRGSAFSPSILPGSSAPVAAPLEGGLLAVAGDTPRFRIRILSPDGKVLRVVCRITSALPFSDAEHRLAAELGAAEPASSLARIGRLFSDGEGRIWAQRDRVSGVYLQDRWFGPPGATFDVLDRSGRYLGEVHAPDDTRLAAAHGNTVIGLRSDSLGAVSVVAFRLE